MRNRTIDELLIRDNRLSFEERFPVRPALNVPGAHRLNKTLVPCDVCGGTGEELQGNVAYQRSFCRPCGGVGFVDMPLGPTSYMPGTSMKIGVMAASLRRGIAAVSRTGREVTGRSRLGHRTPLSFSFSQGVGDGDEATEAAH